MSHRRSIQTEVRFRIGLRQSLLSFSVFFFIEEMPRIHVSHFQHIEFNLFQMHWYTHESTSNKLISTSCSFGMLTLNSMIFDYEVNLNCSIHSIIHSLVLFCFSSAPIPLARSSSNFIFVQICLKNEQFNVVCDSGVTGN